MRKHGLWKFMAAAAVAVCAAVTPHAGYTVKAEEVQETADFNAGWLFQKDGEGEYQAADYDDSSWNKVNLPHDWSIYEDFTTVDGESESGFLPGGTAWYRKHFTLQENDPKHVTVNFEGVYMNSTVYINGTEVGYHPFGYTHAAYDLSEYVNFGGDNVLAVKVENFVPNSRWYSGSGIERDVVLSVSDPICIEPYGVFVSSPDLEQQLDNVTTKLETTIGNHSGEAGEVLLTQVIVDENRNPVSATIATNVKLKPQEVRIVGTTLEVASPRLWSIEDPYRYELCSALYKDGELLEQSYTKFGYRYIRFDHDTGFYLNGEPMKIKGVCLHHDQGALGAVADQSAIDRQIRIMKDMGINAVRSSHNPASAQLLEACSREGILLVDESFDTWSNSKNFNFNDYGAWFTVPIEEKNTIEGGAPGMTWAEYDIKAMVLEARNEPSVIMWGIGNEILGNIGGDISMYPEYSAQLCAWVQELDTGRPCTIADNMVTAENLTQFGMDDAVAASGGVIGFNYAFGNEYDERAMNHPEWILYGSETSSAYSTRSTYHTFGIDQNSYEISSYDTAHVEWGQRAADAWYEVITRDNVAGEFVWTGFDYIGEPEPWDILTKGSVEEGIPAPKSSYFGTVDTCGFPKDYYYFYRSIWNEKSHTLHILPCWDEELLAHNGDGSIPVIVYTDAASVELFLNGQSLGRKYFETQTTDAGYSWRMCEGDLSAGWDVWYEPGVLEAVAYDENDQVITDTVGRNRVVTSGPVSKVKLSAESDTADADGEQLIYITAELVDEEGNPSFREDYSIHFTLEGEGKIVGVDNGSPVDLSSYQGLSDTEAYRDTYHGMALAIVRTTETAGTVTVHAEAEGLQNGSVTVTTKKKELPAVPEKVLPETLETSELQQNKGETNMLEWLHNNWFVLFIYGLFLVFLGGFIYNQIKHWKRGDFKKKTRW